MKARLASVWFVAIFAVAGFLALVASPALADDGGARGPAPFTPSYVCDHSVTTTCASLGSGGDCNFGSCNVKRCAFDEGLSCSVDGDCTLGTCVADLCSGDGVTACDDDGDCEVGPCVPRRCSSNTDKRCTDNASCVGNCVANAADDICSITDDPCVITGKIGVLNGSSLDFGTREVFIDGGELDFGSGFSSMRMGDFRVLTGNIANAITARGPDVFGDISGAFLNIEARRGCSEDSDVPCLIDSDCNLGNCAIHTCTGDNTQVCVEDENCQLGTCSVNGKCFGNGGVSCVTDADCDLGTCGAAFACAGRPQVACTENADCEVGACTEGDGLIDFDGKIAGQGVCAAAIVMRAAGDITVSKLWNISGTTLCSDGGEVELESSQGTVTLEAKLDLTAGGFSEGGFFGVESGVDCLITDKVDANGGDFDGGSIELTATRDVSVQNDLLANSVSGEGSGGFVELTATRDVIVGSSGGTTNIGTKGHRGIDNFGGDGGSIDMFAGRDVVLNLSMRVDGNGAAPDGFGADVFAEAGRDLFLLGSYDAKADGAMGGGGFAQFSSKGAMTFGVNGKLDLTGGDSGGGVAELIPDGDLDFQGEITVRGSNGGSGGAITMDGLGDVIVDGELRTNGETAIGTDGSISVNACRIRVADDGFFDNQNTVGTNMLTVGESMVIENDARIQAASPSGMNLLIHRDAAKPPVIDPGATVSPAPSIEVMPELAGCPVCGNGEIDETETCDDGGTVNNDGCSDSCQLEGCLDGTASPGFPAVPLCDDGVGCTIDTCNTETESCEHEFLCDDGIDCTEDSCNVDECVSEPNHALCDDSDPSTDDTCAALGCENTFNTAPCDDGLFCTEGETFLDGVCQGGTPIDCGDGVACTVDTCDDDSDVCVNTADDSLCDDGLFCTGVETCDAMADCQDGVDVDPDDGVDCTVDSCDEASDLVLNVPDHGSCSDGVFCNGAEVCDLVNDCQAGTPVDPDDGVGCTDDSCDEDNDVVVNAVNHSACDDSLFCNGAETCDADLDCVNGVAPVEDDGVDCTVDACDEGTDSFTHTADDANCDDGLFCNGAETCDAVLDCQDGTSVVTDDGVDCTVDSCDEGLDVVVNAPDDGACDDSVFCNGAETCNASSGCEAAMSLDCTGLDGDCTVGRCDEVAEGCVADNANEAGACDDSDECTENDTCTSGVCAGSEIPGCRCGNGVTDAGEECDDGNTADGDGCDSGCLFEVTTTTTSTTSTTTTTLEPCGNGLLDDGEECDEGEANGDAEGVYCSTLCAARSCGQPSTSGSNPLASDALFTLRSAVQLESCDRRVCDVNGDGSILSGDALTVLRKAVGNPEPFNCPTVVR